MHCARLAATVAAGAVLTLAACADDGNDRIGAQERAEQRAAEVRAATTVPSTPRSESDAAGSPTTTLPAPDVEPTGVVVPVIAIDNIFRPETATVRVGDEVVWENRGMNDHDILHVDGDGWGVEVDGFAPGAVYAHVFTDPGEYRYYCSIHGNESVGMVGTIVVEG